jgi:hypothetical protein
MSKRPPKTSGAKKMGAEARRWVGHIRTCLECGDTKEISEQTYALSNKGKGGWHEVCRVCQGLAVSGNEALNVSGNRPQPEKALRKSGGDLQELIDDMYLEHLKPKPNMERLEEIVSHLDALVRDKPDRESFMLFVDIVKPLIAGWQDPGAIHEDIIDGLLSQGRRRLVIATRYSAKSTLASIWLAWRIFKDPLIKIMCISRGSKLAARMLRTVRRVYLENCPMLAHLVPDDSCLDNAEQFQVPQATKLTTGGATFTSLGVGSNLPGFRADLTVGDDVEGPQEDTPEKVEDLLELLNELHMINPKGEKVMLGTYQSEFSIYAKMADQEDREGTPVWENHRACMFEEDKENGDIRSRWPGMFTDEDAMDWRKSVTERAWRLHAMLIADPSILNERPLKIGQFITVAWPPREGKFPEQVQAGGDPLPHLKTWGAPKGDVWHGPGVLGDRASNYVRTVVGIDPASGLAGRDAIGVAVVSVAATGHAVIRHLEGVRGPDKIGNIRRCAELIVSYEADHVLVEELVDGLFGETLESQLMLMGKHLMVEKVTTGGQQKGRRIIETLAPPMAAGRIVMLEQVSQSDHGGEFANQLVRISYDGRTGKAKDHDDIVDALAHAVANCKGDLTSDVPTNIAEARAQEVDKWRGISMRYGGLGIDPADKAPGARAIAVGDPMGGGGSLGERLVEEDEVLTRYEARLSALHEAYRTMARQNASTITLSHLRKQIDQVKEVVDTLKEVNVL